MARDVGFEPTMTESESVALPLGESRINAQLILYGKYDIIKKNNNYYYKMNIVETNDYGSLITPPNTDMVLSEFLKHNKRYPVIAFTGPAGIGKSTLSKRVAKSI